MGKFLAAAERVLEEAGEPLSAREITERALEKGYLVSTGRTPAQTMKSKLSTDILRRGKRSPFMRTDPGLFGLRKWNEFLPEYQAERFRAALMDEEVVVFPRRSLAKYIHGPGLYSQVINSQSLIAECSAMRRRQAEEMQDVIQLVSVFICQFDGRFLTYKRSKRLPESRLHGAYSVAFGGHLNPEDVSPLLNIFVPDLGLPLLLRELTEEIELPETPRIVYRGLLYDDSRPVSRQHLGIVYDVHMTSSRYKIGERGFLIDAKFETPDEIDRRIHDFENWSQLLFYAIVSHPS